MTVTRPRIPDPPDPPPRMGFNEVEQSVWRAGWIYGYIAALGDVFEQEESPS